MQRVNVRDIEGMEFPAGRRTRVILGDNGALPGELFCQGYVEIHPGGCIPAHHHETVESYFILEGAGEMTVDGETAGLAAGDCVFVERNREHALRNTGSSELRMMFVYAPKQIVEHWDQELSGRLQ